jgi:hypothetical protein
MAAPRISPGRPSTSACRITTAAAPPLRSIFSAGNSKLIASPRQTPIGCSTRTTLV